MCFLSSSLHLPYVSASTEDHRKSPLPQLPQYTLPRYMRCLAGSLLRLDGALNNWIYNHRVTKPITASSMVDASSRNDPKPAFTESLCSYVHTTSQNAIIILLLKQAYFGVYLPSYRTVFCGGHEMPTVPVTVRGGGIYHRSASPSSEASVLLTSVFWSVFALVPDSVPWRP